jgi:hypothetical protein
MATIFDSLRDNSGLVLAFLLVLNVILGLFLMSLTLSVRKSQARMRDLLSGVDGADLEAVLVQHGRMREELKQQVVTIEGRTETIERKLMRSKRHVGLVRYDAFQDIGGLQSFAMAVYDDNGDGVVLSSIIGRAEGRVYGKPLMAGKSDRNLTNEEQQAIELAVTSPSRVS